MRTFFRSAVVAIRAIGAAMPRSAVAPAVDGGSFALRSILSGTCVAAALLVLTFGASHARAQDASFRIIVHSSNPVGALTRDDVSKMFLKKIAAWRSGQPVVPVDQSEGADVRKAFSARVLGREVSAVKGYWQQAIFTGRSFPPVEKASDAEVATFVGSNPSAIGYVSAGTVLPSSVKVLRVEP